MVSDHGLCLFSGRCYKVTSSKSLGQALESLVQKVQCGVVINFEKIGGANNAPPPPPEGRVTIFAFKPSNTKDLLVKH